MARREANKGWKAFAIIVLTIIAIVGIFCAVVGIGAAVNHIGFVEQFKNWFPFLFKKKEEADAVVEGLKQLFK